MKTSAKQIEQQFVIARQRYAELGVDADKAVKAALTIPISLHCWQADDVTGLEHVGDISGGGIMATDLARALYDVDERPVIADFHVGLGGTDVTMSQIEYMAKETLKAARVGKFKEAVDWVEFHDLGPVM